MKKLEEISLNISEKDYRDLPYISYSLLSRYRQLGFEGLEHLYDEISSPSLIFGSAVDTYLTDGLDAFNNRFAVANISNVSDQIKQVCQLIHAKSPETTLYNVPERLLCECMDICQYRLKNKPETRLKYLHEYGESYFRELSKNIENKEIISVQDYQDVVNAVEALKTSSNTAKYFSNREKEGIETCYQLKFVGEYNNINFKCMADIILCDHRNKTIQMCDLKTTKDVVTFNDSFYKWSYFYQASLYTEAVRQSIKDDEYFKDFEILPTYKFITVDRKIFYPVVFSVSTKISDTTLVGSDYTKIKSWKEMLEELSYYQTYDCKIPREMTEEIAASNEVKIKIY